MQRRHLAEEDQDFAIRMATAVMATKSSHAFFLMQMAFGEIDWPEVERICNYIIDCCKCKSCQKKIKEVKKRFR